MTMDSVDDLHAAEDNAAMLADALRLLIGSLGPDVIGADRERARKNADVALQGYNDRCRPTCGFQWDPDDNDCEMYDDGTPACGCPCEHRVPA